MGILSLKDYAEVRSLNTPFTTRGNSWTSVASATKIFTDPPTKAYIFGNSIPLVSYSKVHAMNISVLSAGSAAPDLISGNDRVTKTSTASTTKSFIIAGYDINYRATSAIESLNFASNSTSTTYGNLTVASSNSQSGSNTTRAVVASIYTGSLTTNIDYFSMSSYSSSANFGVLTSVPTTMYYTTAVSSPTIILFASTGESGDWQYVTTATGGTSNVWGPSLGVFQASGSAGSSTRGIFAGYYSGTTTYNSMFYVTFSSLGGYTSFGALNTTRRYVAGISNSTRAIWGAGQTGSSSTSTATNNLSHTTIASAGGSTSFSTLSFSGVAIGASSAHGGLQ